MLLAVYREGTDGQYRATDDGREEQSVGRSIGRAETSIWVSNKCKSHSAVMD